MSENYGKMLISLREYHILKNRVGAKPTRMIADRFRNRPEFIGYNLEGFVHDGSQQKYTYVIVSKFGASPEHMVYCPILDTLVCYNQLKKVELKHCLKELARAIGSQSLNTTIAGWPLPSFFANPYNKNVDKALLKIFLTEYFRLYFPEAIRS